ncbi:ATP-binding protein [Pseudarthrobacter sp. GA104]|uniref:ATP-binding protein n=1 Tax=Pseudarthrobacter sp. GA104 TaxID=2676311 RepID=UPI0012FA3331|nr:ATP-binding protein [Pseudarthrobacter sp. GA104]MUU73228.1 AAA family ATPase [Pseudarthrobacter sp. GA104]
MSSIEHVELLISTLATAGISVSDVQERSFPGERWLITYVAGESLVAAQSLAGSLEQTLNKQVDGDSSSFVVVVRPAVVADAPVAPPVRRGRLAERDVDQLVQLMEARSRTSDALPSLHYVEDPRTSLAAVGASRHQLVYGRRGVGKTALLLEAKRVAEREGHVTLWLNAHVLRHHTVGNAAAVLAGMILSTLAEQGGSSGGTAFSRLRTIRDELADLVDNNQNVESAIARRLPEINQVLRAVLRPGLVRFYVFIDDFYLLPLNAQPAFLDYVAGMLRDCDGWVKVASIERLTRPYEPSARVGLEIPHDATKIDLDMTLEDPQATQHFLEAVLVKYTTTAGIKSPSSIAKSEALGRLVLASGGVPRDYLNLFASSLVVAREKRTLAKELGREDVAVAAGRLARGKKRDLEQDVAGNADVLLGALEELSSIVKGAGYAYFRIDVSQKNSPGYELLALLVDLRFAHLVQSSLSDQHKSGVRYEAYVLDLSEFTDIRLKRGLHVLDLEDGHWTLRLTGQAQSKQRLSGTQLRDELRQSPLVNLVDLAL